MSEEKGNLNCYAREAMHRDGGKWARHKRRTKTV